MRSDIQMRHEYDLKEKRNQNTYNTSINVYFAKYQSHAVFWRLVCHKLSPPVDDDSRKA